MTEEKLADLLAQHLDTLLDGGTLPDDLPAEVAELLTVAQNLSVAAPAPRPEFGPALKESLVGPAGGGHGAGPAAGSAFGGQTISVVVIALLAGAAVLALLVSTIIVGLLQTDQGVPSSTPVQTQIAPLPPISVPVTPSASTEPAPTGQATLAPTLTATPMVDVLPAIRVTVEIIIEPPSLVPGSGGGGGGANNQGNGNDSDHHDEDNHGKHGDD